MANTGKKFHSTVDHEFSKSFSNMRSELVFVEPPADHLMKRARYDTECRKTINIVGQHHTPRHPSFPKVLVQDYNGPNEELIIEARCVTVENPDRDSPFFKLYNPSGSRSCCVRVNRATRIAEFSNLTVRRIKTTGTSAQMDHRRRVDRNTSSALENKKGLRLRFLAYTKSNSERICDPLYSNTISTEKISSMKIIKLSNNNALMTGGTEIILLCEKIETRDVHIRFYREEPAGCWEAYARNVYNHEKVALSFTTPAYTGMWKDCNQPVTASIQLCSPDDRKWGKPELFTFWPKPEEQFNFSTSPNTPSSTHVDYWENNAVVVTSPTTPSTGSSSQIHSRMADPRVINEVVIIPPANTSSSSSPFTNGGHLSPSICNDHLRYSNSSPYSYTSTSSSPNYTQLDFPTSPTQFSSRSSPSESNEVADTQLERSLSGLSFANAGQFSPGNWSNQLANSNSPEYRSTAITPTSYGYERTLNQPSSQLALEQPPQSRSEPNPDHNLRQLMIEYGIHFNLADFSQSLEWLH